MNNYYKLPVILFLILFSFLCINSRFLSKKEPESRLLKIKNLNDFFYSDLGFDVNLLSDYKSIDNKKVKCIIIYRFSSAEQKMLFQDSILLNKDGMPIKCISFRSSGNIFTYFFYEKNRNRYLEVNIGSNKYDTSYTYRKFDNCNHIAQEIEYNIKRKEIHHIKTYDFTTVSDSFMKMKLTIYEPEYENKLIMPFESRDISIFYINNSEVQTSTNRIVHNDTAYNSSYSDKFRILDNVLVSIKNVPQLEFNSDGNWVKKKNNEFEINRDFLYYKNDEPDQPNEFIYNSEIVNMLSKQIDSLTAQAWTNLIKKQEAYALRLEALNDSTWGKSIELKEAAAIEDFTPNMWYLVSSDSGSIPGIGDACFVAGYNTPVKEDESNLRCLAIFKKQNGKYILVKQSFNALETFQDIDDDLLFDGLEETNFNVTLDSGNISINYEYMRGESSCTYTYENGNWILLGYGSSHRTCCQAESSSYNFKTKEYSVSVFSTTEETESDTSYTEIQKRPTVYMDSVNIWEYDYNNDTEPEK